LRLNVIGEESEREISRREKLISQYAKENAKAFGLSPHLPVESVSFNPVQRTSPEGFVTFGFVAELLQHKEVPINPSLPKSPKFDFRGGSTIILDHECNVLYTLFKRVENERRLAEQREFQGIVRRTAAGPYLTEAGQKALTISAIHRGY
ncbi:MAG TPA: hypothetical protein VE398_02975, partial [Acidobacteriota bacterium]|nr:hypothetical protein [Acidobacteriota bacterium]